jgi:hypothetical protein
MYLLFRIFHHPNNSFGIVYVETITVKILDIIRRHVFYLKHDASETGFCLRVQVEAEHSLRNFDNG